MKIALFGHQINPVYLNKIEKLIDILNQNKSTILIYEKLYNFIKPRINLKKEYSIFNNYKQIYNNVDLIISLGGDGTLLDAATIVRDSNTPILGINVGKLGFLSSVSIDEMEKAILSIFANEYDIDKRSLVKLEEPTGLFGELNYGLNELSVIKRDTSSMITISAYINNRFLNTYWADGLIISTPTGSTGYSLSCGGPIISPDSNNFVICPIATHNLTVRPIVIPDNSTIKLKVEGRNQDFLCGLDSRSKAMSSPAELIITKHNFQINLINLEEKDFFKTIRNKLAWGLDKRN